VRALRSAPDDLDTGEAIRVSLRFQGEAFANAADANQIKIKQRLIRQQGPYQVAKSI